MTDRRFWVGFGFGGLTAILVVVLVSSMWVLRTKNQVERRLDQQWAEYSSRTRPLLEPPGFPNGDSGLSRESEVTVDLSSWRLKTLDGESVEGSQLEGRPLFINFWATWCSPCIAELPSIDELLASPEANKLGLRFLLVTDEEAVEVEQFFERRKDLKGLPVVLAHDGIPAAIWFRTRPETALVDCDGRVILRHRGPADWAAASFRSSLERELSVSCGT